MTLPIISKPVFPRVSVMPGVPILLREASKQLAMQALKLALNKVLWRFIPHTPQWGIFTLDGELLVMPDSIIDIGFRQDHKICNYPVQNNAFNSYNKVAEPFQATVRMIKGSHLKGTELFKVVTGTSDIQGSLERSEFLDAIEQAAKSLDLYIIVTPERSYINCNIISYAYKREQTKGAYQIVVDLTLQEVRQVQAAYSSSDSRPKITNAKDVGATSDVNTGKVQAQPFTPPRQVFSV